MHGRWIAWDAGHRLARFRRHRPSRLCPAGVVLGAVLVAAVSAAPVAVAGENPVPPAPLTTERSVLPGLPGVVSEATAAIDPHDPRHMAVAANPYLDPTRIQVSVSVDAGQSWSAPITVLPPGESKSYDPQLGYAADGSLLVTGGASPDTRSGCQGSSEVFIAALQGDRLSFHVLATASAGALLDRPTLLATPGSVSGALVAWTASTGAGADCLLRPARSTTHVAVVTPQLGVRTEVVLPPVAQAPFGSALAIDGDGVFGLVVAGRDASSGITVGVYQSADGVSWQLGRAGTAQAEPDALAGLGGPVLSMPSIAGLAHGFAVAWTDTTGGTARTHVARNDTGTWSQVAAPPADGTRLLPTLAVVDRTLVLLQAGLSSTGLTYYTWQQVGTGWVALATDAGGDATHMQELGELLGLAVGPDASRLTAVPVTTAGGSALLATAVTPAPVTTTPPTAASALTSPSAGPSNPPLAVATHQQPHGPGVLTLALAGSGLLLLLIAAGSAGRRRRRGTGENRRHDPIAPSPDRE